MGLNLEVGIELLGYGASSATSQRTYARSAYTFDAGDYDGATYYFEIVGRNQNTSNAYNVILYDQTNSTSRATINLAASTGWGRYRSSSFTPASGSVEYRLRIDATASANNVGVLSARIVIVQANATKTELVFPLARSLHNGNTNSETTSAAIFARGTGSATYATHDTCRRWKREDSLLSTVSGSAWSFGAIIGTNSASSSREAYASLFTSGGTQVAATEVTTASTGANYVRSSAFASDAANFANDTEYEVHIKNEDASYNAYLYRAEIRVKLTSLSKAYSEKLIGGYNSATTSAEMLYQRILHDNNNWQSGYTMAFEVTGKVSATDNNNHIGICQDSNNVGSAAVGSPYHNFNTQTTKGRKTTSISSLTDDYDIFAETVASTATLTVTCPIIRYYVESSGTTMTAAPTLTGLASCAATLSQNFETTAGPVLTGLVSCAATLSQDFVVAAATTLTGLVSASASITATTDTALTAAPVLTGLASCAASITNTPPARTVTADPVLTGLASCAASIEYTPPQVTSTADPTLTGLIAASASITNQQTVTSTAAPTLTGTASSFAAIGFDVTTKLNLESTIELLGDGVASRAAYETTFVRTSYTFDAADYDGATYYFEIVGLNNNASTAYDVTLRDTTNSVDRKAISIPNGETSHRLYRSSAFTPASGDVTYQIKLPQTAADNDLKVTSARIVVVQANATKTELVFQLARAHPTSTSGQDSLSVLWVKSYDQATYETPLQGSRWRREDGFLSNVSGAAWSLGAIIGTETAGVDNEAYASLFRDDGTQIAASEVKTSSGGANYVRSSGFASDATGFVDAADYDVRLKNENPSLDAYLYRAELRVKLTGLSKAYSDKIVGGRQWVNTALEHVGMRTKHTPASWHSGYTTAYAVTGYLGSADDDNHVGLTQSDSDVGSGDIGAPYLNFTPYTSRKRFSTSFTPSATGCYYFTETPGADVYVHTSCPTIRYYVSSPVVVAAGASTLTGLASAAASITNTPPAVTSTAASTLTGLVSAAATLTYTPPAVTSTAAPVLTGLASAAASITNTPPAVTSTASPVLTGLISASASIGVGILPITITADIVLMGETDCTMSVAEPTLTCSISAAATIGVDQYSNQVTAASTLTGLASASANIVVGYEYSYPFSVTNDCGLSELNPSTKYGNSQFIVVAGQNTPADRWCTLIGVEDIVPLIPPEATITDAKIIIYNMLVADYDMGMEVRKMNVPWSELDATWNMRTSEVAWTWPGALKYPEEMTLAVSGTGATVANDPAGTSYELTGAGMISDVQGWVDAGYGFGWVIRANEPSTGEWAQFHSSESTSSQYHPVVVINYTMPEGTGSSNIDAAPVLTGLVSASASLTVAEGLPDHTMSAAATLTPVQASATLSVAEFGVSAAIVLDSRVSGSASILTSTGSGRDVSIIVGVIEQYVWYNENELENRDFTLSDGFWETEEKDDDREFVSMDSFWEYSVVETEGLF